MRSSAICHRCICLIAEWSQHRKRKQGRHSRNTVKIGKNIFLFYLYLLYIEINQRSFGKNIAWNLLLSRPNTKTSKLCRPFLWWFELESCSRSNSEKSLCSAKSNFQRSFCEIRGRVFKSTKPETEQCQHKNGNGVGKKYSIVLLPEKIFLSSCNMLQSLFNW